MKKHTYTPYWSDIKNSVCTCGLARVFCIRINGEPMEIPVGLNRYADTGRAQLRAIKGSEPEEPTR